MSEIACALVTGANGFIGSRLCAALRRHGIATRGLVLPGTDAAAISALGVEVVAADVGEPLDPVLFAGASHVFHLAAIAFDWGPDALFERVNVQGTRHVLDAALAAGARHLIHMSSLAVHAYSGHPAGDENTPRDATINAYARSKNRAEDIVQSCRDRLMLTVIRPGVVPYGPGDRLSLPGILDALDRGIYRHVAGGRARVCLSYVDNLAEGMLLAARREGPSGETYVLSDDVVTWRAFIDAIASTFGRPPARQSVPFAVAWCLACLLEGAYRLLPMPGSPPLTRYRISLFRGDLVFSPAKAVRELGYRPAIGLEEGLRQTRGWLAGQGRTDGS